MLDQEFQIVTHQTPGRQNSSPQNIRLLEGLEKRRGRKSAYKDKCEIRINVFTSDVRNVGVLEKQWFNVALG